MRPWVRGARPPPACLCMSSLCRWTEDRCDRHRTQCLCVRVGGGQHRGILQWRARKVAHEIPFYLKYRSPAEADRLVMEVDGGEEAGRRRGAVVSATLHLPAHSIGQPPLLYDYSLQHIVIASPLNRVAGLQARRPPVRASPTAGRACTRRAYRGRSAWCGDRVR